MKHRIILFLFVAFSTSVTLGQNQPSNLTSNYAGILAVPSQPANIADNRYRLDINIVTAGWSMYNNYIALKGKSLSWYLQNKPWQSEEAADTNSGIFQDPDFQDKYLFERNDNQDKSVHFSTDIMLPSFLYTIDQKNAVALTWRIRSILNVDGIGAPLAEFIYNDFNVPENWLQIINNPEIGMANMSWAEYGFGYGRVLKDNHKHFFKAGFNFKIVHGMHAMYMQIDDFNYEVLNQDSLSVFRRKVSYGHSESYDPSQTGFYSYNFDSRIAPALDIGIIYEFRPKREKYKYDMDGEYDRWMNDKNKYKWKFGLSITDIGRIKFNKSDLSYDYIADTTGWNIGELNPGDWAGVDSIINSTFEKDPNDKRTFRMALPTALSIQIDYNIWNDFYINFTPYWALYRHNSPTKVHNITSYSLTPRYDHKFFGVSVPISYNNYANTAVGLALRVGPVTVGTTDFVPYITAMNVFGFDGYFSVKVPLFRRGIPSDKDGDKVSDKKDDCPEIPGLFQYNGCPDIDNDGIADIFDECPADSGIAEFKGCPDRDGDGIIDKYDECPTIAGVLALKGCPDTDNDGLIDPQDSCPTLAGIMFYQGCPDTDGDSIIDPDDLCPTYPGPKTNGGCPDRDRDGIFDYLDECPEKAGPSQNNGCPWPDTDLDGILDKDDRCPNNPGPAANQGCPYTDTDGDSIYDKDDDCPNVPGVRENKGCPVIELEDQEIINTAFSALEFVSGKAIIANESYSSLDELGELMIRKSEWKLKLSGHTDNVGAEQNNLILSKQRAEAVQDYLASKGIVKDRIKVEFFGESEPIESNDTPAGRQKNRRVEMKILFE